MHLTAACASDGATNMLDTPSTIATADGSGSGTAAGSDGAAGDAQESLWQASPGCVALLAAGGRRACTQQAGARLYAAGWRPHHRCRV